MKVSPTKSTSPKSAAKPTSKPNAAPASKSELSTAAPSSSAQPDRVQLEAPERQSSQSVDSLLTGISGWASESNPIEKATTPVEPTTPEYGENLREKLASVSPELAEKLNPETPGRLSPEDLDELVNVLSQSPELGGLEGYLESATADDNGYKHGWTPGGVEAFGKAAGSAVVPTSQNAGQVSHDMLDETGLKQYDEFYKGYQSGLDGQTEIRPGMDHHLGTIDETLTTSSRDTQALRNGKVLETEFGLTGFRGRHDDFTVRTFEGWNGNVQPGVDQMNGGVWVDRGEEGLVQLNGPELREATLRTMSHGMETEDPITQDLGERMLGLYSGAGGQEGRQRVEGIYRELGLPMPSYLSN